MPEFCWLRIINLTKSFAIELLERAGLQVSLANNGKEAIEMVTDCKEAYHAILMDIQMPVIDGYEATQAIRKLEANPEGEKRQRIPIIAMTAHAMVEERRKCLESDMDDHIAKPIDYQVLYNTLVKWIPAGSVDKSVTLLPEFSTTTEVNLPGKLAGLDIDKALQRLNGNKNLLRKILLTFGTEFKGTSALIEEAAQRGDMEYIYRTAHTFKGLAGTLGANVLWAKAVELEEGVSSGKLPEQPELLDNFTAALKGVLASIDDWQGEESSTLPKDTIKAEESRIDRELITTELQELSLMLEKGQFESFRKLQSIKSLLHENLFAEEIAQMQKTIENYDFEEAQGFLSGITARLKDLE